MRYILNKISIFSLVMASVSAVSAEQWIKFKGVSVDMSLEERLAVYAERGLFCTLKKGSKPGTGSVSCNAEQKQPDDLIKKLQNRRVLDVQTESTTLISFDDRYTETRGLNEDEVIERLEDWRPDLAFLPELRNGRRTVTAKGPRKDELIVVCESVICLIFLSFDLSSQQTSSFD
jgi:hypothetical protein